MRSRGRLDDYRWPGPALPSSELGMLGPLGHPRGTGVDGRKSASGLLSLRMLWLSVFGMRAWIRPSTCFRTIEHLLSRPSMRRTTSPGCTQNRRGRRRFNYEITSAAGSRGQMHRFISERRLELQRDPDGQEVRRHSEQPAAFAHKFFSLQRCEQKTRRCAVSWLRLIFHTRIAAASNRPGPVNSAAASGAQIVRA